MSSVGKDPVNAQAAQQEAEERKLKRKKALRGKRGAEGGGVEFDEESENVPTQSDLKTSAPVEEIMEGIEEIPDEEQSTGEKVREIKIISDGTFPGTQIFIDGKETRTSDMKIFLSKTSGFVCKITQEVDLFRS